MKAQARTPRDLFDTTVCYVVPPFQRPYVWTERDQWQSLWDDIRRVTVAVLNGRGEPQDNELPGHFLGAVVVKQLRHEPGEPSRFSVIDGQQRLTTLQLILDSAQRVMAREDYHSMAESVHELVVNGADRFRGTPKRFKLWPSRIDREAFEQAMDDDTAVPPELEDDRIVCAHRFFITEMSRWATSDQEDAIDYSPREKLSALAEVLQQHLWIVVIRLSASDEDQLIFETLNDRGTPLLAADLIKNYVFQRCDEIGIDVDSWGEQYWGDFDADWWREEIAQGRLFRSRIDIFLQYWLTMRVKDEIPADRVFTRFQEHANILLRDMSSAEEFLSRLRSDADTYRDFAEFDPNSAQGRFYVQVVEALELGAFIPLFLWIITSANPVSPEQADRALGAVESWAVRRTLLRRTMKDVNRMVVTLLRELDKHPASQVGDMTIEFLRSQTADARIWPTDDVLMSRLPDVKAYGNIKQQRLRAILSRVELQLRSQLHEDVSLPSKLDIEHVMPQGWRRYWSDGILDDLEACIRRDHVINTIGNLTMVTESLNRALSNRPWTDEDADNIPGTGQHKGLGKRSLLNQHSVLVLNRHIVDGHLDAWTEADIQERSASLASAIASAWPYG